MNNIKVINYQSWEQFKTDLLKDLFKQNPPEKGKFIFRGQTQESWSLESTFDRKGLNKNLAEKMLIKFKEEYQRNGNTLVDDLNDEHYYALGQHYGLPTRLLDWSESHYIAAFFALSDVSNDYISNNGNCVVWALDTENSIWSEDNGIKILKSQKFGNSRVRNQYGLFTLLKTPQDTLEEFAESFDLDTPLLYKFLIPATESKKVLIDLDFMGIDFSRVYPDIEGCARAAFSKTILAQN